MGRHFVVRLISDTGCVCFMYDLIGVGSVLTVECSVRVKTQGSHARQSVESQERLPSGDGGYLEIEL